MTREQKRLPGGSLGAWLSQWGFIGDPFRDREASREAQLAEYFVEGPHYDEIRGDAQNPQTSFVFGARGCGKTAYRVMIQNAGRPATRDSEFLAVPYIDLRRLRARVTGRLDQVTLTDHLAEIVRLTLETLIWDLAVDPAALARLSDERRGIVRWLVQQYAPSLTRLSYLTDRLRGWNLTAVAQVLEKDQDEVESDPAAAAIQTILNAAPMPLDDLITPGEHLAELVGVVRALGIPALYVLIDGLDELAETADDPQEAIPLLLRPLIADLVLLEQAGIAFKFFLPADVAPVLLGDEFAARLDRLPPCYLEWSEVHLRHMLAERLAVFSGGHIRSLDALADPSISGQVDARLIQRAHGSPRALMVLGQQLLTACATRQPTSDDAVTAIEIEDLKAISGIDRPQQHGSLVALLSLDLERQRVLVGGREIGRELTKREFAFLACLYQRAGRVVTRDEVRQVVYLNQDPSGVSNEALDSLAFRVRQKFEPDPKRPIYVTTERGTGYILNNTV
ncbi:MAG: winged helix-turn-helix domain-containing protein [Chloroflexi bacterium]|nr:winged helix-turn-helix domain-containing protein [Chloroflexota bacterium]MBU1747047.1 winged helix-turn-helix domain-containing protein [Chloroflexota bacterium]